MATRSLQASTAGIQAIKKALKRKSGGQTYLAGAVGCSRQTIWSLLQGNAIDFDFFTKACAELGLNWEEIAKPEATEPEQPEADRIAALVQATREQVRSYIQQQCGTMRVLDMTQPIALTGEQGIYTSVNILEKLTGRRRLELPDLLKNCDSDEFERFGLSRITEQRVPGLEAAQRYPKLMVLGKPGAGKTTFLKYLTMQCIAGNFAPDRVPLFVTLKDFAEAEKQPSLLDYLVGLIPPTPLKKGDFESDRADSSAHSLGSVPPFLRGARGDLTQIISTGKALILLDGLDEVREEDTKRVLRQIEQLSGQFPDNQFVITCRIAAKEYSLEQFTEVEVADFNAEQIKSFATQWFCAKGDTDRATLFQQKLNDNQPIAELATNPLLLTLLCLMFEDVTDFPANRSELYKEGLDILLKKWDGKRKIERDAVYKNLSLKRKEDLLSQIALTTFEQKEYFFKQRALEDHIADFIRNLPDAKTDPEALHLDSEAVLKSIEAHHGLLIERAKGIYSFSHLTFQEYFAAREIVTLSDPAILQGLSQNITEKRWREVFLLTAGIMRNADDLVLLMKQRIDQLLAGDKKLQQFLKWVQQKSSSLDVQYKVAAIRASYFQLALGILSDLDRNLRDNNTLSDLELDHALSRALAKAVNPTALNTALNIVRNYATALDPELQRKLQELREQANPYWENSKIYKQWWQVNNQAWKDQLRAILIEHRNIGHDWQFTDEQEQLLRQYYDANKLLVDCLNSDCYVSRSVREAIEDTLLLPIEQGAADG
ncbi:MAG TPA: NACHT domain-containing NTPase [Coleofasciculaceae cyanobacterium]|jgi:predicted NACHT family NTPase